MEAFHLSFFSCGVAFCAVVAAGIAWTWTFNSSLPIRGDGFAAPGWRKVADVFRASLDSGAEKGGAVAVYHDGKLVVQFHGGYADPEALWAWEENTLTQICSCSKAFGAVVIAMLVERGHMSYTDRISRYWPEFAVNSKEDITVEQLLSHQAGLSALDEEVSLYDMVDNPQGLTDVLAKQKPNWKPGAGHGYHGTTLGLYLDQLVKIVDPEHRTLAQYFHEEIAKLFDLDLHIGLPLHEFHRTARMKGLKPLSTELFIAVKYWPVVWAFFTDRRSLTHRSIVNPKEYEIDGLENHPKFRTVPTASSHGFGTATSLAKFYSILASGGSLGDKRLLKEESVTALTEVLSSGVDQVLLFNVSYGRGMVITHNHKGDTLMGTPGAGGQNGQADVQHRLAIAYVTNHHSIYAFGDDPKYLALRRAAYDCIDGLEKR